MIKGILDIFNNECNYNIINKLGSKLEIHTSKIR